MMDASKETCSKCGNLTVRGALSELHKIEVFTEKLLAPSSRIDAYVCQTCGHIDFYVAKPEVFQGANMSPH